MSSFNERSLQAKSQQEDELHVPQQEQAPENQKCEHMRPQHPFARLPNSAEMRLVRDVVTYRTYTVSQKKLF
jgi:hypothetical protein